MMERIGDPWLWSLLGVALGLFCGMLGGMVFWAFRPRAVAWGPLLWVYVATALLLLRRFVQLIRGEAWTVDWAAALVACNLGLALLALLAAVFRGIERDRAAPL